MSKGSRENDLEKMKAIKANVEHGNGSEHKKKSELMKMFKEFGNFYHSLVKKYDDDLRFNTCHGFKFHSGSSATNDNREMDTVGHCKNKADDFQDQKRKGVNSAQKSMDAKYAGSDSSEKRKKQDRRCEFVPHELCNVDIAAEFKTREVQIQSRISEISSTKTDINELETVQKIENEAKYSYALDPMWPNVFDVEIQITKLAEDNLKQLAELIRRNDEKRETIKRLQAQLEELRRENTLLRFSVQHSSADAQSNEAHISRTRRIALLFRGCSP